MLTCSACGGLTPRDSSTTCLHCDGPLRAPRWARKLAWLLGPAGTILLAACYGAPGRFHGAHNQGVDADADGSPGQHQTTDYYGTPTQPNRELDCDDADPARYPGAQDTQGDGIDQNCDGVDGWRDPNTAVQPESPQAPTPIATPP